MKLKKLTKKHIELLNAIGDTMINSTNESVQFFLYVDLKVKQKEINNSDRPAIPAKYHGSKAAKSIADCISVGHVFIKDNVRFSCSKMTHEYNPYSRILTFVKHIEEVVL